MFENAWLLYILNVWAFIEPPICKVASFYLSVLIEK